MLTKYNKPILKLIKFSDSKLISHIKLEPDTRHNISIYSDLTAAADSVVKLEKFTFKREKKLGLQYKQTNSLKVVNEVDGFQRNDSSVDLKRNAFAVKQEADASPLKRSRWEPAHWLEQYARIKEMRSGLTAPVDTCGCDSIARFDPTLSEKVSNKSKPSKRVFKIRRFFVRIRGTTFWFH